MRDALDFYKHPHGWTNRLVAGDSLLVMNSLLEKEGLAGKVQMIYIDPPYGIRYGSNFQPFVNRRDVKDGKDEDLTQEPEMIKAFRDTWELGIHSYLTSLRDRLLLARDMLAESGSIFVQISDDNLHHLREVMDEVFGVANAVSIVVVKKTGGLGASGIKSVADYLLWYAKDRSSMKYRALFQRKELGRGATTGERYDQLEETGSGTRRTMMAAEREAPNLVPDGWRAYQLDNLTSGAFRENTTIDYEFEGEVFHPGVNACWKSTREGLSKLTLARRIQKAGRTIRYVRFLDDFPACEITNLWDDVAGAPNKVYVVQTSPSVIQRCMLMTTDPGDLVLDITCESGTTAFVAETWGRRWITCDTSRVAITLAKQRLLTAVTIKQAMLTPRTSTNCSVHDRAKRRESGAGQDGYSAQSARSTCRPASWPAASIRRAVRRPRDVRGRRGHGLRLRRRAARCRRSLGESKFRKRGLRHRRGDGCRVSSSIARCLPRWRASGVRWSRWSRQRNRRSA